MSAVMIGRSPARCECTCLGCEHFCGRAAPAHGQDAHHTRLLLALDRLVQAACLARGIPCCDGLEGDEPCDSGMLHSRTAELARAFAVAIEGEPEEHDDGPVQCAVRDLLVELRRVLDGKALVS